MDCPIIALPPEMQANIFKCCNPVDLLNIACCSKAHYASVKPFLSLYVPIQWRALHGDNLLHPNLFASLKYTTHLWFSGLRKEDQEAVERTWVDAHHLYERIIGSCDAGRMTRLSIADFWSEEAIETVLQKLPDLQDLSIKLPQHLFLKRWISPACISGSVCLAIGRLTRLRRLHIDVFTTVAAVCLDEMLTGLPNLEYLAINVGNCRHYVNNNPKHIVNPIKRIASLTQLRHLDLSCYGGCPLDAFEPLVGLKSLVSLNLKGTLIFDENFCEICASSRNLQKINISYCPQISEAGLIAAASLPSLHELDIRLCPALTEKSAAALAASKSLKLVYVATFFGLIPPSLELLKKVDGLEVINDDHSDLSDMVSKVHRSLEVGESDDEGNLF